MAIKRCPYCRSIIDERDQFCNNCGTQLLFPEDEFIEEEVPGEKVIDVDEKALAEDVDIDLSLEEPEAASIARSATSLGFPETLTAGESAGKKRARKSKKSEEAEAEPSPDRILKTSELPEMGPDDTGELGAARTSSAMLFEEAFPGGPAATKQAELKPAAKTQVPAPVKPPAVETRGEMRSETPLSASAEEIEDIARMMSAHDKAPQEKEPVAPPAEKPIERDMSLGDTSFYQRKIEDIRIETLRGVSKDKAGTSELKKSAADVPPWATGLRVEPPPLAKTDIPGMVDNKRDVPPSEPAAGLTDILNKLEQEPAPSTQDEDLTEAEDELGEEAPPTTGNWPDIPDRETEAEPPDSWSDRLGRERREGGVDRPIARRATASGSKLKAKFYDVLLIVVGWVVAVWLATRILSVSMPEIFDAALVPLLLFLLTLAVAYFFLFLYFLGETLGDRLSS